MLIPVYLRGSTYYLHIRIAGTQFKRSLHTKDKNTAIIKASKFLEALNMTIDWSKVKKYEVDLQNGIFKSDGPEDHRRMLELLGKVGKFDHLPIVLPSFEKPAPISNCLTLLELLDKYLLLKKPKPATAQAYKIVVAQFEKFIQGKSHIDRIITSDITRYQEHLAHSGNKPRTIDNKIANLKTLLNFALTNGYLNTGKNPVTLSPLQSKKVKLTSGYSIFEPPEIQKIFSSTYYKEQKSSDPDYYFSLLLGLITGCRSSELTSLSVEQIQLTPKKNHVLVIRESKTPAGKREIPLPEILFEMGFGKFLEGKTDMVFRYKTREGKGSGNAVGKKFSRHLEVVGVSREKLVFHSFRKFLNDYLLKNGVEYEPRCQFIGHEIDAVNVATYSRKFSADQLCEIIFPHQIALLKFSLGG